jgi:WD40 repeat protein
MQMSISSLHGASAVLLALMSDTVAVDGTPDLLAWRYFAAAYSLPRAASRIQRERLLTQSVPTFSDLEAANSLSSSSALAICERPLLSIATDTVDGNDFVAVGVADGTVRILPFDGGSEPSQTLSLSLGAFSRVTALAAGPLLLAASAEGTLVGYSPSDCLARAPPSPTKFASGTTSRIHSISWHPSGRAFAMAAASGAISLFVPERSDPILVQPSSFEGFPITSLSFHEDGSLLAAGSADGSVRLWDVRSGRCVQQLPVHSRSLTALAFGPSPCAHLLLSAAADGAAALTDLRALQRRATLLPGHLNVPTATLWLAPGLAATAGHDSVVLWNTTTMQPICRHPLASAASAAARKATGFIVACHDGCLRDFSADEDLLDL